MFLPPPNVISCLPVPSSSEDSFSFSWIPLVTMQTNTKTVQAEDPSAILFQRKKAGNKSIPALLLLFPGVSKATKHQLCWLPTEEINMKLTLCPCSILPPTCAYCFSSCAGASIFCLSTAPRRGALPLHLPVRNATWTPADWGEPEGNSSQPNVCLWNALCRFLYWSDTAYFRSCCWLLNSKS